jgi:YHS domain-containing protein
MNGRRRKQCVWVCVLACSFAARAASGQPTTQPEAAAYGKKSAAPTLPLVADGYCVVTLRDSKRWQRGNPTFGGIFDERQYMFAGQREFEIFSAAPIVYAPVLAGDCIVTFALSGQRVAGRAQFGTLYGGRLYFFASPEARQQFAAAPKEFIDADIADGGHCLVSRVDSSRVVRGRPDTAVLCNGMRRMFAGAHEQRLYLANPERYDAASATPGLRGMARAGARPRSAPDEPTNDGRDAGTARPEADDADTADDGESREEVLETDPLFQGYCPVSIRTKGVWVRGRQEDRVVIDDHLVFFTAGPEEHDIFLSDPIKYIPALGGYCAVSLVDQDRRVKGSMYHAWEYLGRLYLFADEAHKAAFKADPAKYASVDLAANGVCVVTLAEKNESKPGFAEFSTWYDGKVYRFLGEEQRQRFLKTPERYAVKDAKDEGAEDH